MGPIDHIYAICDSEYQKCALQQESEEGPLLLQINLEETERKVSLTLTFEALMVKFGGKIGTLYQMLKNAFKKHHFSPTMASLIKIYGEDILHQY